MTDPTAQPPVPFDEMTDDAYAAAFLQGLDAVENGEGSSSEGRCPRCGDPMDFSVVTEIFQRRSPRRRRRRRLPRREDGVVHVPGDTSGAAGRGQGVRRLLERPVDSPDEVMFDIAPGSPGPLTQRRAAKATQDLLADELPRVRTSAVAWRNGLGALLAGLIGFGLVKGRSDVTQLTPTAAAAAGFLLLAALVAGSVAAVLLMRAAHGRPRPMAVEDVIDRSPRTPP